MKTASQFYALPDNRATVKAHRFARLRRFGDVPETFRGRVHMEGWIGTSHEPDGVRASHEVAPRAVNHKGWYVDSFKDETACGVVLTVRIPRRLAKGGIEADERGTWSRVRFLEGVRDASGNTFFSRSPRDLHDDERGAAMGADREAETHAEECREAEAKDAAAQQIEDAREEIKETRAELAALLTERRKINQTDLFREVGFRGEVSAVCRAIRGQVATHLEKVAKLRGRIDTLESNYWEAVAR